MIKKFGEFINEKERSWFDKMLRGKSKSFPTTEDQIIELCKKYNIQNYSINPELSIDVEGDVTLNSLKLPSLPLRFSRVGGNFRCYDNHLTTLEGSPREVEGSFICFSNRLTTLEGSPREVGGHFDCSRNQLTTLEGSPREIGERFDCSYNLLTTLDGVPREVGGDLRFYNNPVTEILDKFPDDKKVLKFWDDFDVVRNGNEISAYRFKEMYLDLTGKEFEGDLEFNGYKVVE